METLPPPSPHPHLHLPPHNLSEHMEQLLGWTRSAVVLGASTFESQRPTPPSLEEAASNEFPNQSKHVDAAVQGL